MPSIGSAIQRTPDDPRDRRRPPRRGSRRRGGRPGCASRISSSDAMSTAVTMSVGLDFVVGDLDGPAPPSTDRVGRPRAPSCLARSSSSRASAHRTASCLGTGRSAPMLAHAASRGLGQQSAGADIPGRPTGHRAMLARRSLAAVAAPRARAAGPAPPRRSSGWTPAVAARAKCQPELGRRSRRLGVEVVDDLHVVGDEADRHDDDAGRAAGRPARSRWSLTSGSSQGSPESRTGCSRRAPRARSTPVRRGTSSATSAATVAVLRDVGAAVGSGALGHRGRDRVGDEDKQRGRLALGSGQRRRAPPASCRRTPRRSRGG